jgi:hypothetical protein
MSTGIVETTADHSRGLKLNAGKNEHTIDMVAVRGLPFCLDLINPFGSG